MKNQRLNPVKSGAPRLYLFEDQIERAPGAIAVRLPSDGFGHEACITYDELERRANQVAHFLRARGVGPEVLVGLFMERSLELVVAVLGVVKAGGAYVPLDPANPQERLAFMVEDARLPLILTQERLLQQLPACNADVVCLDTHWSTIAQEETTRPLSGVTAQNLTTVLYTSGSTGRPKAVMRPHGPIPDRLGATHPSRLFTSQDRHLLKSSLGVVAFNNELFRPLGSGGQMVIVPTGRELDPAYLVKLITEYEITVIDLVPSMLRLLLDEPALESCTSLRCIICSGEALPLYLQERLFSRLDVILGAYYGTTESPGATFWKQTRRDRLQVNSIGQPVADRQVYILDDHLQPVPVGVAGELYLGSALARGYLNRPDLTAERFIPNPITSLASCSPFPEGEAMGVREVGERMYKTGDLGRYLEDGSVEFLGRADDQVQIRGFRVEPGEIETVLAQHPGVRTALVLAQDTGREPDQKRLVAYVVPSREPAPTISELRNFLQQELPRYMLPSAMLRLDALPLLPNGKVDRQALLALEQSGSELKGIYVAPRSPVEEMLASMWAELLGLEKVGIYDNFFELGGHSLLAARLVSRTREDLAVELSLTSIFEKQTIAELALWVENGGDSDAHALDGKAEKISLDQALRLLEGF
jgi:amino acid adenylation domain-containing protein